MTVAATVDATAVVVVVAVVVGAGSVVGGSIAVVLLGRVVLDVELGWIRASDAVEDFSVVGDVHDAAIVITPTLSQSNRIV